MRHQLGWADLSSARVGIFGVGVEGRAARDRLGSLTPDIVFVDDDPNASLPDADVIATNAGGIELLSSCDVVIKSPGISAYRDDVISLDRSGVAVVGGVGLTIHDLDRSRVICVTGTKGKSTTASVLGHLLTGLGLRTEVTGNLGRPPFDPGIPDDLDILVIETSSFQALDIADAPGVVAVTSLAVDHLDWHGSIERYHADKLSITTLPDAGMTLAQGQSSALRERASLLGGDLRWVEGLAGTWAEPLGLIGSHNLANAEMARSILLALDLPGADNEKRLREAAEGFEALEGRLSDAGIIRGVRFFDDGLATNVLPTLAALDAFPRDRLAILVGGFDRGVDYTELIDALSERQPATLVIGLPESGRRLAEEIWARGTATEATIAESIEEATRTGFEWAGAGGVVLLSPAAPSFSQFKNWKERSQAFRDAIAAL